MSCISSSKTGLFFVFWACIGLMTLNLSTLAQERDRLRIPVRHTWNLGDIYPNDAAWRSAKEKLQKDVPQFSQFKGRLGQSASVLADALDRMYTFDKELNRLYTYASLLADQDTRDSAHLGMRQEMVQLEATLGSQTAFLEPEVLRLPQGTIERFLQSEPRLKVYRFLLEDIVRRAPHTLSESEERILADAGPLAGSSSEIYGILTNADFPYPSVTLSDGRTVKVDQAGFADLRMLGSRQDRETVMAAFFMALGGYSRTFGTTMNANVQKELFFSKARKYGSALERSLNGPNIPVSVYSRLVDGVNRSLPTFHRYLKLRKQILGVSELHYYDLYAPLVESVNLEYTPEEAQKLVLGAVAPLGSEYTTALQKAFDNRWIDLFPTEGKRSGAYMNSGAYDVHPYVLINYNGKYPDVSTVAHELGHAMHSYLSNQTQPYPLAQYTLFVAEVASTFNESMLIDYMLANLKDDNTRLSLLGNYLENIKGTVFRQTQFAEFELKMHEMAQKGEPITGAALAKLYLDITRKYYGHDKGVSVVDDYVAHEWSYIPHFYRDFYVYQYATSFTASLALAEKVKSGDPAATRRYLTFLRSGGSKYPIDLLKDAGVDMTTNEPLDLLMKAMNRVMDDMEKLLAKRAAPAAR